MLDKFNGGTRGELMEIKSFLDKNGNPIKIGKIYVDVLNNVPDIHIIEQNGNYFAKPDGLDSEPLESVCGELVVQE